MNNNYNNHDGRSHRDHHPSTQDFENQNSFQSTRGKEGYQEWRSQDYNQQDYQRDNSRDMNYGEHYGQGAYGRAQYNPEQNRGASENFPNREQDYRGGEWNRENRNYEQSGRGGQEQSSRGGQEQSSHGGYGRYGNADSERSQGWSLNQPWERRNGRSHLKYLRIPSGMEQFDGDPQQVGRYQLHQDSNVPMSGYGTLSQYGRGPHSGKGPKNYSRSDERLQEEICEHLTKHDEIDASDIEVMVRNGEVTLSGTVPDRRTKRLAEDEMDHILGIKDVKIELRVANGDREAERSSTNARPTTSTTNGHEENRPDTRRSKAMA